MIDICDFAVGCRASFRHDHRQRAAEQPDDGAMAPARPGDGDQAVQLPRAVWAWNAALALVCGDPLIWKPSEKTPLCAEAVWSSSGARAAVRDAPDGPVQLVQGGA